MFKTKALLATIAFAASASVVSVAAQAGDSNGDFQIKVGVTGVLTDDKTTFLSHTGVLGGADLTPAGHGANTEDMVLPTATLTYYATKNIAVELFCCFGGTSVTANDTLAGFLGAAKDAEIAHATMFPPILTLQYHFDQFGAFRPYVGVGVQYIHYFNEKVGSNALGMTSVNFKDSWGVAVQGGFDLDLGKGWSLGFDVKKTWLDTEIEWKNATNTVIAKHDLDPLLITANLGYRFNLSDLFGSRSAPAPLK